MNADEIVATIDRHFVIGNPGITIDQLRDHKRRGTCEGCERIVSHAAAVVQGSSREKGLRGEGLSGAERS